MKRYNPKDIEPKWQKIWDETGVYTADLQSKKPKYFAMSMFNYPSGAGIHIGHAMNYTISDVKARFKRQQGYESYHPVGWDAFGLPAENYAIKAGVSPQESMANIIPGYHKQYKAMGWSNDWEKEIATHLPEYYKWTQWIFAQMHKHGLAYQDSRLQWWCAIDNTVLANEQVIDGKCWRHDGPDDPLVQKREVKQWFFKITDYADELLEATDDLDWTEGVKLSQKNWIGRSQGIIYKNKVRGTNLEIESFSAHFEAFTANTFVAIAPDHPFLETLLEGTNNKQEILDQARDLALRRDQAGPKGVDLENLEGIFSGRYAVDIFGDEDLPIWITSYALADYGTGIVLCSAHDERDFAFAKKYDIRLKPTLLPPDETEAQKVRNLEYCYTDMQHGILAEPADFVGKNAGQNRHNIVEYLEEHNQATAKITYRMRDWSVGRQRYWGAPIPIVYCANCAAEKYKSESLVKVDVANHLHFNKMLSGDKKTLTRAKSSEYADVKKSSVLELIDNQTSQKIYARVQDAKQLNDLEELFNDRLTLSASFGKEFINLEELEAELEANRPGYVDLLNKQGIVAWSIELLKVPVLVPEEDLPVVLPELTDFKPAGDGRSALARATDWLKVDCPKCGAPAERETDTLDTYICSSWYMLRYLDPHNQQQIFDSQTVNHWMPVDFYNGADHATAHLLYARFITRFFHKIDLVDNPEPFRQMLYNGKVTAADGSAFSKSKGNGVDPLEIINQGYGADALRTYLMFAAPLELGARWDPQGVPGAHRFLSRLWNLVQEYLESAETTIDDNQAGALNRATHQMIKKVSEDIEAKRYNTAIAAGMQCLNEFYKLKTKQFGKSERWQKSLESLVACVAPFAPHIADELWQQLGHSNSIQRDSWPKYDEKYLVQDESIVAIQVNGKLRGEIRVADGASQDEVVAAVKNHEKAADYLNGPIQKIIYVPGKIINFVI